MRDDINAKIAPKRSNLQLERQERHDQADRIRDDRRSKVHPAETLDI